MLDTVLHESKIYVAGHRGLIGSALMERMKEKGFRNLICKTHEELNLTKQDEVDAFFEAEKPEYVVLKCGYAGQQR